MIRLFVQELKSEPMGGSQREKELLNIEHCKLKLSNRGVSEDLNNGMDDLKKQRICSLAICLTEG